MEFGAWGEMNSQGEARFIKKIFPLNGVLVKPSVP